MKKTGSKTGKADIITVTLVQSRLLTNLVEKLAQRRKDIGYGLEKVQPGWQAIETSSIEAHVSVDIHFNTASELINMPLTTCFLFSCIKGKGQDYDLAWASSLS